MPLPSVEQTVGIAVGGVGAVGFGTMFIRFLMRSVRADKMEAISVGADTNSYTRLQNEIKRLEGIINRLNTRCESLEARLDRLRDVELADVRDIATISVLVDHMPCGKCLAPSSTFDDIREALERISSRRNSAAALINPAHAIPLEDNNEQGT